MHSGIIGLGFVGNAILNCLIKKNINVTGYDKYNNKSTDILENMLNKNILFICLPTIYNFNQKTFDLNPIETTLEYLNNNKYNGIILIKSTLQIKTIENFDKKYQLKIIHNPEFLSAKTAEYDFLNQNHIVLGKNMFTTENDLILVTTFYNTYFPNAHISICSASESESMKLFCNNFYSVKIQFFNELYLLCQNMNIDFKIIKSLMLKNNWINPTIKERNEFRKN